MAVIRHSGRDYPGSLIQGDSLKILIDEVHEALEDIKAGNSTESINILESILERLEERMKVYKQSMMDHDIKLPF